MKTNHKHTLVITTLLASFALASCDKVKEQATEKAKEVATEKMNELADKASEKLNEQVDNATNTNAETDSTSDSTNTEEPSTAEINLDGEFDWSKIPVSTANIGEFPYVTAPKGMYILEKDGSSGMAPTDQKYTTFWDFNKLIMFDGKQFFNAEGKRALVSFGKLKSNGETDSGAQLETMFFDRSIKDYLESIGAVLIHDKKIDSELLKKINEKEGDEYAVNNYVEGDPFNDKIRQYALNHQNGKIFFQIWSNNYQAEIGVIELEGFEQTIKAPTASEIKQQLDADGKAVLHINFDTGKASIKPDGQAVVEQINLLLQQNPELKLSIEGHTDNVGQPDSNLKLSKDRANTVMYALGAKGIDIARLKADGFGDTKPMVANDTDENKAKNRRVELVKQ